MGTLQRSSGPHRLPVDPLVVNPPAVEFYILSVRAGSGFCIRHHEGKECNVELCAFVLGPGSVSAITKARNTTEALPCGPFRGMSIPLLRLNHNIIGNDW